MTRHIFLVGVLLAAGLLTSSPSAWASGAASGGSAAPTGSPTVRIKPLMLPVINARGAIEKYNQVEVTLEITDGMRLGEAQTSIPRLHDTILAEVYKAIEAGWIVRGNIVNATALRKRLDEACEEVLGKGMVGRVLIAPMSRQSAWP